MPGAVIPCGRGIRKRSATIFLRYGIQSLYIGPAQHRHGWQTNKAAEISSIAETLIRHSGLDPESRVFIFRHFLATQLKTLDSGCCRSGSECARLTNRGRDE